MTNSAWKTPHFPFPAPSVTRNSRPKLVNVRQHLSDCWPVFLIEGSLLSISVFVRKNNIRFLEEREKKKKKDLSLKISKRINYNKNWNETLKSFHKNNICDSSKKKKKRERRGSPRTRSRSRTWKISRKINYNKNWNKQPWKSFRS